MLRPRCVEEPASWVGAFAAMGLLLNCVVTDVDEATGGTGGGIQGPGGSGGMDTSTGAENAGGTSSGGSGPIESDGVDCGGDVCGSGNVCCIVAGAPACTTEQACVDLNASAMGLGTSVLMKCDDILDCEGDPCCVRGNDELHIYECSASGTCPLYESCSSELECSNAAEVCVNTNSEGSSHKCVDPNVSVDCGAAGTCSGAAALCCDEQTPSCADYDESCGRPFECDGGSDCGSSGAVCCATPDGSMCHGECLAPSIILCDDIGDCPTQPVPPTDCVLNPAVGPGYKMCAYP